MVPSPGVSTFGGALNIRSMQVGFPAKLKSTYNSSTGYTWERLAQVAGTGVVAASLPQTGAYAYAADGNTGVAVNTEVWLEPDANGQGYTIVSVLAPLGTSSINFTFVSAVTCDADGLHVTTKTGTVGWNGTGLTYSEA